jgi:hypothetical protein
MGRWRDGDSSICLLAELRMHARTASCHGTLRKHLGAVSLPVRYLCGLYMYMTMHIVSTYIYCI